MDWVPFVFIDAVCCRLKLEAFTSVSQLSAGWSEFGAKHHEKRREFATSCRADNWGRFSYSIKDRNKSVSPRMVAADLDLEFDRITSVSCKSKNFWATPVSLYALKRDVFPTIAALATNCTWCFLDSEFSDQNRIFFEAFKNCPGFDEINVQEQGEEPREFVARQLELGNVQKLYWSEHVSNTRPGAKKLNTFVNSARFHQLIYRGPLLNEFELFEVFLKRALEGELKTGARIWIVNVSLDESQRITTLHPEHRDSSKGGIAWRIPKSSRRVTLQHFGVIVMKVE